jgi:hypothetical protein
MKKLINIVFFISASVMMQFAKAQTADEIINKHITAMGGKEKLLALKTMKITGTNLNPQGINVDVVHTHKHMVGVRTDRNRSGAKAYTIATPKKGWVTGFGETTPRAMDDDQLKGIQNRLDIQGALINYKEKGSKIELAGKEKVEGTDCFNLKVTDKNGIVNNYYIDSKTYRISKRKFGENSTLFLNYKQNAGGYWFAYTNKQSNGAVLTITKIETNIAVDDKIFQVDEGVF